jgi:hypothetical protein
MRRAAVLAFLMMPIGLFCPVAIGANQPKAMDARSFAKGLPSEPSFFPIAVWLQQPHNAEAFKSIGINTFVGLWNPPTEEWLSQLEQQGMHLIVEQTPEALALKDSNVIRGWMQIDEPDNAQPDGKGGYVDCIMPKEIVRRYEEMRSRDATRPVFLNFGQGVANPEWIGRGATCAAIAQDRYYTEASRGADIVGFDIYPVAEVEQDHVKGRLELVGRGVRNLKQWVPPGVPIWADIETTHINNPKRRATPSEIYSEVWIAIINGANGIMYFVHEWQPSFREDGVFRYQDTVAELTKINKQIGELALLLNSPSLEDAADIRAPVEIARMVKQDGDAIYVFAANMENKSGQARVSITSTVSGVVTVLGEGRTIELKDGSFDDHFKGYGVHIYQVRKN